MKRLLIMIAGMAMILMGAATAFATAPTATSFSATASTVGATLLQLQGGDVDGTPLVFAIGTGPSHGALSGLDTGTGYVVYTPTASYTGADSFTFTVTSGGATTSPATVTLNVTNAKTRIVDTVVDASGTARSGLVTFILTQKSVLSPGGLVPVSQTVSSVLSSGQFDVSLYPSASLSPQAYYQLWYTPSGSLRTELIGVFNLPASSATSITLAPYAVTDTNLVAQYTFMSAAALNSLATGLAGSVTSFNTRVGAITPATNDYTWAQINKSTSSLADITTRSASDLSSGTVATARLGSGTASSSTYLRGDQSWATLPTFYGGSSSSNALPYGSATNTLADSPLLRYSSNVVGFGAGSPAYPTDDQLVGTRLLLLPGSSGTHVAIGVGSNQFWMANGSPSNNFGFYFGSDRTNQHQMGLNDFTFQNNSTTYALKYACLATPPCAFVIDPAVGSTNTVFRLSGTGTARFDFSVGSPPVFFPHTDLSGNLGDGTHRFTNAYVNNVLIGGSTSGTTTVVATATASGTLTLPAATDTLVGKATTDTLTNKTLTSPAIGTSIIDTNGHSLFTITATSSAVNGFTIANAATGSGPILGVGGSGSDTNADFTLKSKGTGTINFERGSDAALIASVDTSNARFMALSVRGINSDYAIGPSGALLINSGAVSWFSNSTFSGGSFDVSLTRAAPSVVALTDGSTGGGTIAFKPCTPSQLTGNVNNWNPGCSAKYLRISGDAVGRQITGMTFSTTQVDGQEYVLVNVGSNRIDLINQSGSSTAANRFLCDTGTDISLAADAMADVWYDGTTGRWRVSMRN